MDESINSNIFRLYLVRSLWLTGPCIFFSTVQSCNNIAVSSSTEYELEVNYDGSTIEYFVDGAPANCGSGSNSLTYTSGLIGTSTPVSSILTLKAIKKRKIVLVVTGFTVDLLLRISATPVLEVSDFGRELSPMLCIWEGHRHRSQRRKLQCLSPRVSQLKPLR